MASLLSSGMHRSEILIRIPVTFQFCSFPSIWALAVHGILTHPLSFFLFIFVYIGLGVGIIRLSPHTGSILISKTETKLLIGCVKNPVGKATNGRNMKKVNWTGYISYINKFPMSPLPWLLTQTSARSNILVGDRKTLCDTTNEGTDV